MDTTELIANLDEEINRLRQVRDLLAGSGSGRRGRGRPAASSGANSPRKKRVLSAAAKAKIRAAQKKRWAEWHKTHKKAA